MAKTKLKSIPFTVDLPHLFQEICRNSDAGDSRGVTFGLQLIMQALNRIALHSIKTGDMVILRELENMGVVNRDGEQ